MFDRLKSAISSLAATATKKTLDQSTLDDLLWSFQLSLMESDVAQEVADALSSRLKHDLLGKRLERSIDAGEYVKGTLKDAINVVFSETSHIDLIEGIDRKRSSGEPYVIVFLGINGTGKTTTIAKFAKMLKDTGYSVVVACADTHRAGAIEQLTEHARRVSAKIITQKYGADPAAVARDAVLYAKSHHIDVVLVDTAGRMQTSRNLMEEMSKIIRVVKPDLKVFIADSLVGNDAISQAREFRAFTDFDAAILTKADADVKGGVALSVAYATKRPILFLGIGQGYGDLAPFYPEQFVESLFPS